MQVVGGDGAYSAFATMLRLKIFNQKVQCGEEKKVKVMEIETSRVIGKKWKNKRERKEKKRINGVQY